jgi:CHAT domain-containing protein
MAVVATPARDLATPLQEQAHLLGRATAERHVTEIAPLYSAVKQALSTGTYDGWHFAGHANTNQFGDANRSQFSLQDGPLRPQDLSGAVQNLGHSLPFVFLNACRSGQTGFSLAGLGGFAQTFLRAGASGFIGTHWAVQDGLAAEFARTFYDGLLDQHLPLGEAIRRARAHIRRDDDPTWLAYTVYGHPLAQSASL